MANIKTSQEDDGSFGKRSMAVSKIEHDPVAKSFTVTVQTQTQMTVQEGKRVDLQQLFDLGCLSSAPNALTTPIVKKIGVDPTGACYFAYSDGCFGSVSCDTYLNHSFLRLPVSVVSTMTPASDTTTQPATLADTNQKDADLPKDTDKPQTNAGASSSAAISPSNKKRKINDTEPENLKRNDAKAWLPAPKISPTPCRAASSVDRIWATISEIFAVSSAVP